MPPVKCLIFSQKPKNRDAIMITFAQHDVRFQRIERKKEHQAHDRHDHLVFYIYIPCLKSDMEMFLDVFCYNLTIEQVDDTVCVVGIVRRVSHHDDGCSLFVQL